MRTAQERVKRGKPTRAAAPPTTTESRPILLSAELPQKWNDLGPLRATALVYAPEDLSRILRWFASKDIRSLLESHGDPENCGSSPTSQLRAAMENLRFTARFLSLTPKDSVVVWVSSPSDVELRHFADELALKLKLIADLIAVWIPPKK